MGWIGRSIRWLPSWVRSPLALARLGLQNLYTYLIKMKYFFRTLALITISMSVLVASKDKSIKRRVTSYNKYRYKAQDWYFFYGDKGSLGKSRYCTSEVSSSSKVWCPFWRKNFDSFYSEYYKLFIEQTPTIAPTKIQNINAWDEKPKPKRICREITITIEKWEYLELSFMGRLRRTFDEMWKGDSLKICKDI